MFEGTKSSKAYLSMASYEDSLAHILDVAKPTETEMMPIETAIGRVLAADLSAPISVPSFDNSAMDGFAFSSRSTEGASSAKPVTMPIVGASIAGDTAGLSHLQPGFAAKIMTGAPLPDGADTILPVEFASWNHEKLTFYEPYPTGKHVRCIGEDIKENSHLLCKRTRIDSQHIPLLCALGLQKIPVSRRPKVSWITTGQEISDNFNEPLVPGHIYNATGLYGATAVTDMGLELASKTTVRDTPQDFSSALDDALDRNVDIILSTGGVSAGQYDFVRPVLEEAGATITMHKSRIKPGKPVLFAVLPNGAYFFGLPGNPISTALALRAFVYPFVRKLSGLPPEPILYATLENDCKAATGRTTFLMGNVDIAPDGQALAKPNARQQSFQTTPFAHSNAWIVIPEDENILVAGTVVRWLPMKTGVY